MPRGSRGGRPPFPASGVRQPGGDFDALSEPGDFPDPEGRPGPPSLGGVQVVARQEEDGRISGELVVLGPLGTSAEGGCSESFLEALRRGAIMVLKPGTTLVATDLEQGVPATYDNWADLWLPGDGDAALRLARQIGSTDVIDLVTRTLGCDAQDRKRSRDTNGSFRQLRRWA